eukprot:Hpha_TRINITY_DN22379_c0_g1::TRINITY_DN22379_c0_g1_i1::g.177682::m.177682
MRLFERREGEGEEWGMGMSEADDQLLRQRRSGGSRNRSLSPKGGLDFEYMDAVSPTSKAYQRIHLHGLGVDDPEGLVVHGSSRTKVHDLIHAYCIRTRPFGPWPGNQHGLVLDVKKHPGCSAQVLPYCQKSLREWPAIAERFKHGKADIFFIVVPLTALRPEGKCGCCCC